MTDDIINLEEAMVEHEFVIDDERVRLKRFESHPVEGGVLVFMPEPYIGITFTEVGDLKEQPERTPEERLESAIWHAMHLGEQADRLVAARAHLRSAIVGPIRQETQGHELHDAITERISDIRRQIREIEI